MNTLLDSLKIELTDKLYVKDPESSDLGKRILSASIEMIHELGFEQFTFKKLGTAIGSNESSIYRYFENKHKLLLYLTNWYWGWMELQLVLATNSIDNSQKKLHKAIEILTQEIQQDSSYGHINESKLHKILIEEYSKSFLTKEVDKENKEGYFMVYKRLAMHLSKMIQSVNSTYPYPSSLASTILEGSLHQQFLQDHFTSITDCNEHVSPTAYFVHLTTNVLK
ncbi:TetR/AcrR family transcriptional regulator [Gangjinia marincola]|uniref:TetR/AcrR family transcriptional regulator n=1 Tax=Gangjinia marincola TaxID=578463 RepID=A0ABN1MJ32_9FLAO